MKTFGHVLESVETLSLNKQEELAAILQRRLRERHRADLVRTVKSARKEFQTGRCQPALPEEIINSAGGRS